MNPTKPQLEAYRLVHIQGLTQASAAGFMGITQPAVCKHLMKLDHVLDENITPPKFVTYDETRDYNIIRKF